MTYYTVLEPWLKLRCAALRQVVLATNIAETSLTIEDVVYVVDTGKLKVRGATCAHRRCCRRRYALTQVLQDSDSTHLAFYFTCAFDYPSQTA